MQKNSLAQELVIFFYCFGATNNTNLFPSLCDEKKTQYFVSFSLKIYSSPRPAKLTLCMHLNMENTHRTTLRLYRAENCSIRQNGFWQKKMFHFISASWLTLICHLPAKLRTFQFHFPLLYNQLWLKERHFNSLVEWASLKYNFKELEETHEWYILLKILVCNPKHVSFWSILCP